MNGDQVIHVISKINRKSWSSRRVRDTCTIDYINSATAGTGFRLDDPGSAVPKMSGEQFSRFVG